MESIIQKALDLLFGQFRKMLMDVVDFMLDACTTTVSGFWDHYIVVSLLNFVRWLGIVIVGASLVMVIFDIVEDLSSSKEVQFSTVFISFIKGLAFALVAPTVGQLSLQIGDSLAKVLHLSIVMETKNTISKPDTKIIMVLCVILACCIFAYQTLRRFGTVLVLIASCVLYIPDIVRGETSSMGAWIRQTLSVSITFLAQYLLFYLGFHFAFVLNGMFFLGLGCWFAIGTVPKVLSKWGNMAGSTGGASNVISTISNAGIMLLSK